MREPSLATVLPTIKRLTKLYDCTQHKLEVIKRVSTCRSNILNFVTNTFVKCSDGMQRDDLDNVRRDSDLILVRPQTRAVDVGCTGVSSPVESSVRIARLPAAQM